MNDDNIQNANKRLRGTHRSQIPPPRRSTAEKWHDVPEHAPPDAEPQGDWPEPEPIRNDLRPVAPLTAPE